MAHKHPYKFWPLVLDPMLVLTLLRLMLAGWRPWQNRLGKITLPAELELFDEARRVLENFGGLKIDLPDNFELTLDQAATCEEDTPEKIKRYAELCGEKLYPLGGMDGHDYFTLIIGESGMIYLLKADEMVVDALDFEQFLKAGFWFISNIRRVRSLKARGLVDKKWRVDE